MAASVTELVADLRNDARFMATVAAWRVVPAQTARTAPITPALHPVLAAALHQRGIEELYSHQAEAVAHALASENVAIVTPTASGKTLCYNLPIFHTLLSDPSARALYLFPTKALAQDQLAELHHLAAAVTRHPSPVTSHLSPVTLATYDGDTPAADRARIRKTARVLLTNPDMLHVGILPYHTQWADFLTGLCWVVIDEMHTYRGVFGSQVANVLRRLRRLCAHYGSDPHFICTSATIANPQSLAERLVAAPVTLIDDNGAPRGAKHVILINPPLLDPEKGIRRSATLEATDLAARCLHAGLQTIVFGRSRLTTELLLSYLREGEVTGDRRQVTGDRRQVTGDSNLSPVTPHLSPITPHLSPVTSHPSPVTSHLSIRGYRGGYLPTERRAIEAGLRSGEVRGVVATNALELGIDIGGLQAAVVCGYPGSIASTWQQMGRAGRTQDAALAILVASGGALDQYIIQHPEFLFERSPEHALINPDNLMLLLDQVRCATFELPFEGGETFGGSSFTADALQLLAEEGEVHSHGGRYFWSGEPYPARQVSLRSTGGDAVVIQADATVIGSVDQSSAPLLVHAGAVYLHEGQSHLVQRLDLAAQRADVTQVNLDYYTEATSQTELAVQTQHATRTTPGLDVTFGDVAVTTQVVGFRRIKRFTHETLGVQLLEFPPSTLETSAYWFAVQPGLQAQLEQAGLWYDSINDYGPNWQAVRASVRTRDHYRCTHCGRPEPAGQEHDVHHKIPFRAFGYVRGVNENYRDANHLENLVLVCRACHLRLETAGRLRTGLDGLAYALANLAPVHLMCDPSDLGLFVQRGGGPVAQLPVTSHESPVTCHPSPVTSHPSPAAVYLYERVPAGLGFSAQLYELHDGLLAAARDLVAGCGCRAGCPACVGPVLEEQPMQLATKQLTLGFLELLAGA